MLQVTIDNVSHTFPVGTGLLQALRAAGCAVPQLCHDDRLQPTGACRLCIVEIEGETRPVASCTATLRDGMKILTATPMLEKLRTTNLTLLAKHYPAAAVAREPEHPLHQLFACYGVAPGNQKIATVFCDDSHPYIGVALERCIHCQRCVRICDEVQGQFVWANWQRGEHTHIAPARGATLLESGCVACGACIDSCPSGALFDKANDKTNDKINVEPASIATQNGVYQYAPDQQQKPSEQYQNNKSHSPTNVQRWTRSTCVYCGVGCQLEVGSSDHKIVAVRPAAASVNRGHLCVKGRYAFGFTHAVDRVTTPMLRSGDGWRAVSWDEALDFTATKLRAIHAQHGADAIGVLGSARATNEDNYLAQKFARVVLGTNNVDCCARVCHTPSAKALKQMLGTGAATNRFDDIENTQCLLIFGCNPTENHPVVGARIKQAVLKGARLIVIDPRRIELAEYADLHLAIRPGHNVALLNAMAATLIEENLLDSDFIATRVAELDEFTDFVRAYAPEKIAAACGVSPTDIRAAARLYATSKPAMCFHGLGATEHTQGTEGVMALINLALLTGNFGKPGCGINPLRGQNNVQGAAQMGCDPVSLTGAQTIDEARAHFESIWRAPIPATRGLDLLSMLDAASAGTFKALWAIGYDVFLSLANADRTAHAFEQLELVIVQDLFLNETARAFGTVFFPAASVFEKDGTFMNSDRRVQRVRQSIEPLGECEPDWWIIQELAKRMAHPHGFEFADAEQIWNEVRALWPAGAGLTYQRLANEDLHWPCPDENHPGTPILHVDRFQHGKPAVLARIPFVPTAEQCDANYPLLLTTGRTLYQFNAGTMTGRTANNMLRPSDTLDMAPLDAARLTLHNGDSVRVRSRYGSAVLPLRVLDSIKVGEVFATFHSPDLLINRLTSPYRDRLVNAPEYKVTAVRVEKIN